MILSSVDFPSPLRPTMPSRSPAARFSERFSEQRAAAEFHSDLAQFDHAIRQLRRRRDDEIDIELRFRRFLRRHLEIALHPIDRFRPARARRLAHPGQLALQEFLALVLLHFLDRLTLGARQQVIGVVPVVAVEFSARKLDHPRRDRDRENSDRASRTGRCRW